MSDSTDNTEQHLERKLACKFCKSHFNTPEEYAGHAQMYHSFRVCAASFNKGDTSTLGDDILHKCQICTESFRTYAELQYHSLKHPLERTLKCRFCGIAQTKQIGVILHEKACLRNECRSENVHRRVDILHNNKDTSKTFDKTVERTEKVNNSQEGAFGVEQITHSRKPIPMLKCVHCGFQCKKHPDAIVHFLRAHYTMNKFAKRPMSGQSVPNLLRDSSVRYRDEHFFYCDLCGHKKKLLSDLTAHIINHLKIPLFCEICKCGFSAKEEYKWHMLTDHELNTFSCKRCGDVFERLIDLESHRLVEHGKGNQHRSKSSLHPCHVCGKFILKDHISKHLKDSHEKEKGEDPFICNICGTKYLTKPYYVNHMREHEGLKRFKCSICYQAFMSEENLERHQLVHPAGPRPYKCRYCDATYKKHNQRKRHENVKHIRNYSKKCPDCGMSFLTSKSLKVHSVVHTKVKRFECNICDMKFTQQASLGRHKKIHSGDKKHECPECGLKCVQKSTLTRHMLVHSGEKPHQCLQCPQAFRQVFMLTQHVRKQHSSAEYQINASVK